MKLVEISLNGKEVGFRLTSGEIANVESRLGGKSFLDLLQDSSITMCATLLKHMRRWEIPNFSQQEAYELLDEIFEKGYTYSDVYWKIIAPVCVNAGIISESALKKAEDGVAEEKN